MEGQLKNGTILTSESGNKYTVVNLLGAGGQGEVYDVECDGKHYALKWYFKGSATARQKKLLEEIIAKGAPDSSFLWPMELIVPSQGNLFGCSELNHCLVCDEHLHKEKYSLKRCKYCGMF